MEEYVSYHKILQNFQDYQVSQTGIGLNSFGHGNIYEFSMNQSGSTTVYPLMFVNPTNVSYDMNTTTYTFQILFADRINDDMTNQVDVVSDMSIQMKRFVSFIKRGMNQNPDLYNKMDSNLPITGLPFMERFNDYVGGISLDIEITIFEDINACVYYLPPSPTPSNTPTQTITPTPTKTFGLTPTATVSPTQTVTPSNTATPTVTPTKTPTNTPTNTITQTPTNTSTKTPTPTNTPTVTNTQTGTPSVTATPTNTSTPTNTITPTNTASVTPSVTPTETPTNTPTNTETPTVTPTNTPTQTSSQTPTVTPTNTETPTNTPTPTNTETPTNTPTPTNTETPTNTPSVTTTNTQTPSVTATNTQTPSVTATNTQTPTRTATPPVTPTVTPFACRRYQITGTNSGSLGSVSWRRCSDGLIDGWTNQTIPTNYTFCARNYPIPPAMSGAAAFGRTIVDIGSC
jgi:hypothetical protein